MLPIPRIKARIITITPATLTSSYIYYFTLASLSSASYKVYSSSILKTSRPRVSTSLGLINSTTTLLSAKVILTF